VKLQLTGCEMGWWQRIEHLLIDMGVIFGVAVVLSHPFRSAASQVGHVGFEMAQAGRLGRGDLTHAKIYSTFPSTDFSLWSEKRIREYKKSLAQHFASPLAFLEIPKIHLDVPVFNGTNEAILNRGVGRIIGTARLGVEGNTCIAGHRDGFFRALKDVSLGDLVKLVTPDGRRDYEVKTMLIVDPDTVDVLKDQGVPMLTLVTCYPFYFAGDAPQRFILQCSLKGNGQRFGK
jgi:sortase A